MLKKDSCDICAVWPPSAKVVGRRALPDVGTRRFSEELIIQRFLESIALNNSQWVLDLGCGLGNKMQWVKDAGYNVQGVDINPELVAGARQKGFDCMTVGEFLETETTYDAILAAHIVEHFSPADLLTFLDGYLDRLNSGGYLLVSTPLEHSNFYADFDHVKVYHPEAFWSVFSVPDSQVQYHARNRLRLIDLRLRRTSVARPRYLAVYETFYRESFFWRLWNRATQLQTKLAYQLSGGVIGGATTGWVGLFQKV